MSDENRNISNDNEKIRAQRRRRIQEKRKKRRNRKILVFSVELLLLLVVIVCIVLLTGLDKIIVHVDPGTFVTNPDGENIASGSNIQQPSTEIHTDEQGNTVVVEIPVPTTSTGDAEAPNGTDIHGSYNVSFDQRYTTIVVFGMDGRGEVDSYASGSNSDVIILVSIDNETGEIRMSSIYRDSVMKLYTDLRDHYDKANYAICAYGVPTAVNTLNMNLDLNIDYFVCVDWEASVELISALGGVDITLERQFWEVTNENGQKVPYFNGLLDEIVKDTGIDSAAIPEEYFNGSVWHADGPQAVAYMRLRYGDSDIYRTRRQREVIDQVIEKAKTINFASLLKIWNIVSNSVKMNISESDILGLLQNISNYHFSADTGSQGYPTVFYDGADYGKENNGHATQWMIIPVNVVENVKQLHAFLYPADTDYEPKPAIYKLDEEIRKFALFDENWEPTFDTQYYGK